MPKTAPKKSPHPIDIYVGARVRLARLLAGMSQDQLGAALGLTFQQVQKYEKGTNRIGASRLNAIACALKRPVAWFFEGLPADPSSSGVRDGSATQYHDPLAEFGATRDGQALARAFNAIADRQMRAAIVWLAESCARLAARACVAGAATSAPRRRDAKKAA